MLTKFIKIALITTIFASNNMLSFAADTLVISPKITPKHYKLKAVNYDIYLTPPDNTFKIINEQDFGIESKKYDATITMKFRGAEAFETADSIFALAVRYFMKNKDDYTFYKSNNMLAKYIKYKSIVGNDTMVTWNMICGDDLFALVIFAIYPAKYDKKISSLVEKSLRDIVITINPDIKPETNIPMDFDYSGLDLIFFQRHSTFAIFSEDGLPPPKLSKGNKFIILSSVPTTSSQRDNLAEQTVNLLNNSFVEYLPSRILPSKIVEVEIQQQNGVEIAGAFEHNENLVFLAFMLPGIDRYHFILAFAPEKDSESLFAKARNLIKTIRVY